MLLVSQPSKCMNGCQVPWRWRANAVYSTVGFVQIASLHRAVCGSKINNTRRDRSHIAGGHLYFKLNYK